MQIDLFTTHAHENNQESQLTLAINQRSFQGQNKKLFDLLMSGKSLTFRQAYIEHNISDIRRRVKDLRDIGGFYITDKFIGTSRDKEWFMTENQRAMNKEMLKTI